MVLEVLPLPVVVRSMRTTCAARAKPESRPLGACRGDRASRSLLSPTGSCRGPNSAAVRCGGALNANEGIAHLLPFEKHGGDWCSPHAARDGRRGSTPRARFAGSLLTSRLYLGTTIVKVHVHILDGHLSDDPVRRML